MRIVATDGQGTDPIHARTPATSIREGAAASADREDRLAPRALTAETEPSVQAATLQRPVEVGVADLEAVACRYGWRFDQENLRLYATTPRTDIPYPNGLPPERCCETILRLDSLRATTVFTSLSTSALELHAKRMSGPVRSLFASAIRHLKGAGERRQEDERAANERLLHYDGEIDTLKEDARDQIRDRAPELPQTPLAEGQLARALPVPEGTTAVFRVPKEETLDVCSGGFVTCMGVVLVGRHADGSRVVGMTHLSQDVVERVRGSFGRLVQQVIGPGASLEVYLVGGGHGHRASLSMALSLFAFFEELQKSRGVAATVAGQSLFRDEEDADDAGRGGYLFRSTDEGLTMHRTESPEEEARVEAKEAMLEAHDDLFRLTRDMSRHYLLASHELFELATEGKPHPLLGVIERGAGSPDARATSES